MTIETKYNIGDEVWFMFRNKAIHTNIVSIKIKVKNYTQCGMIRMEIGTAYEAFTPYDDILEIAESLLFPTKEELLKSL